MPGADAGVSLGVIDAIDAPTEPGERARAVRRALGLSRVKVARSAGLSRREIARTEHGRRELTETKWRALAGSLGVDPEVLVPAAMLSADDVDAENRRIDECIGHVPDDKWTMVPRSAADLPAALPVDLPDPERRRDQHTRARIERSWSEIRRDLDDVIACCDRLAGAGSGDDAEELLETLDAATRKLSDRRSFHRRVARHRKALGAARQHSDGTRRTVEAARSVANG